VTSVSSVGKGIGSVRQLGARRMNQSSLPCRWFRPSRNVCVGGGGSVVASVSHSIPFTVGRRFNDK
jgi:hypothetical protein